jgi:hypothetical protein
LTSTAVCPWKAKYIIDSAITCGLARSITRWSRLKSTSMYVRTRLKKMCGPPSRTGTARLRASDPHVSSRTLLPPPFAAKSCATTNTSTVLPRKKVQS